METNDLPIARSKIHPKFGLEHDVILIRLRTPSLILDHASIAFIVNPVDPQPVNQPVAIFILPKLSFSLLEREKVGGEKGGVRRLWECGKPGGLGLSMMLYLSGSAHHLLSSIMLP